MPDESKSNPQVNIISIASDDDMWVVTTDLNSVLTILADPVDWISANVTISGSPAVLWQPFVVVFQQVSGTGSDPSVQVQGINETALMTVQYVQTTGQTQSSLFPSGSTVAMLQVSQTVYTHLELTGFTPTQVANTIFTAATNPTEYFAAFNALPQTLNGSPVPVGSQLVFKPSATASVQYVYEGWTPTSGGGQVQTQDPTDCSMSFGDADSEGNVWVNGVIVKTYSPTPAPGPGPG